MKQEITAVAPYANHHSVL